MLLFTEKCLALLSRENIEKKALVSLLLLFTYIFLLIRHYHTHVPRACALTHTGKHDRTLTFRQFSLQYSFKQQQRKHCTVERAHKVSTVRQLNWSVPTVSKRSHVLADKHNYTNAGQQREKLSRDTERSATASISEKCTIRLISFSN